MQDGNAAARETVSDAALDLLFREARSHIVLNPPVSDDELRAIYDLTKWGPTTANSQPQRIVFIRSEAAKARLAPALSATNLKKVATAPVVALLAYDPKFYEHMPRLYHDPKARTWYEGKPNEQITALRNATLQGGYFMLAARAIGLDVGPMSGFDNAKVDAEFFPDGQWKSNFLCALGRGDPAALSPRNYRFAFDEVCRII